MVMGNVILVLSEGIICFLLYPIAELRHGFDAESGMVQCFHRWKEHVYICHWWRGQYCQCNVSVIHHMSIQCWYAGALCNIILLYSASCAVHVGSLKLAQQIRPVCSQAWWKHGAVAQGGLAPFPTQTRTAHTETVIWSISTAHSIPVATVCIHAAIVYILLFRQHLPTTSITIRIELK